MQANTITYLQRHQIDSAKWNACITSANNGLVYAFTDYLDAMAGEWDALVMDDYKAVMPLPWRKKWRIAYLYPPFLTAQLGVFGNGLDAGILQRFLQAIPTRFRLWDFPLNHHNLFPVAGFPLYLRSNYILSLNKPYEDLYKAYRENIRRNIKKSSTYGNLIATDVAVDDVIALTKLQAATVNEKEVAAFKKLFFLLKQKDMGKTYGVLSSKGEAVGLSRVFVFVQQGLLSPCWQSSQRPYTRCFSCAD